MLVGGLLALTFTSAARPAAAQIPSAQPGSAAIWTEQGQYQLGESVQVCYSIPVAGPITISDLTPDRGAVPFFSGTAENRSGCVSGDAPAPLGRHCLRLEYPLLGGSGTTQTCFQVAGPNPPPPGPTARIVTDRASYHVGDPLQVCYQAPGPRPVTITDVTADGAQHTLFSGYDDGTGGCFPGIVTPPAGTECLLLNYGGPAGTEQPSPASPSSVWRSRPAGPRPERK